jgi:uncharacterized protein (TIGR03435 family)
MAQHRVRGKEVKQFYGATMGDLVWFLSLLSVSTPIRDRTGLTGRYDFTLQQAEVGEPSNYGDTLNSALNRYPIDQLGLVLKPGAENRSKLVIDHNEKPTAN